MSARKFVNWVIAELKKGPRWQVYLVGSVVLIILTAGVWFCFVTGAPTATTVAPASTIHTTVGSPDLSDPMKRLRTLAIIVGIAGGVVLVYLLVRAGTRPSVTTWPWQKILTGILIIAGAIVVIWIIATYWRDITGGNWTFLNAQTFVAILIVLATTCLATLVVGLKRVAVVMVALVIVVGGTWAFTAFMVCQSSPHLTPSLAVTNGSSATSHRPNPIETETIVAPVGSYSRWYTVPDGKKGVIMPQGLVQRETALHKGLPEDPNQPWIEGPNHPMRNDGITTDVRDLTIRWKSLEATPVEVIIRYQNR